MAKAKYQMIGGFGAAVEEEIKKLPFDIIDIASIKDPPKHDRSQYDESAIPKLAKNIKKQGLLQPIVVRKLEDGLYERVAGFRRIKAVLLNGETTIHARIIDAPDTLSALKAMLSENTEREGLNAYDKAVFFEEIIQAAMNQTNNPLLMDLTTNEIKKRLMHMRNQSSGVVSSDGMSEDEQLFGQIMQDEILSQYGFGLHSFVKFMAILDFDERIIEAIKERRINRTVASEINRLASKHSEKIPEAINRAHKEEMGKNEVSLMVSAYIKEKPVEKRDFAKDLGKVINIKKIPEENREKAQKLVDDFVLNLKTLLGPSSE